MPRTVRRLSEHNLYHIVLKGNNSQRIFYDDSDYTTFLNTLSEICKNYNIKIVAYCLMSNHIHLMLKAEENNIAFMFKSFGASFVYKYNKKYDRTGGLFNGRYYSKAINDDAYFKTVIKYIHFNPVKAGISASVDGYKWSSFNTYNSIINGVLYDKNCYVDSDYLFTIIEKNEFKILHLDSEEDLINFFIIDSNISKKSDSELMNFTNELLEKYSVEETVGILRSLGASKAKVSKMLEIDRRKII